MKTILVGVLLAAALLFSQVSVTGQSALPSADPRVIDGVFEWFRLNETRQQIRAALGDPSLTAPFGSFQSWQYQIEVEDRHEFSHYFVFRQSTGQLISVTRNFDEPHDVEAWFPPEETTVHHYPDESQPTYSMRVRQLSGGRVLIAMGSAKAGEPVMQIFLIQRKELRFFYPWLFEQLEQQDLEAPPNEARGGPKARVPSHQ